MQAVIVLEIKEYSHFISLGCFCGVAEELERLGLRDASYPFDWLIGPYDSYIKLINSNFDDFLNQDYIYQWSSDQKRYDNIRYDISFFTISASTMIFTPRLKTCRKNTPEELSGFTKV